MSSKMLTIIVIILALAVIVMAVHLHRSNEQIKQLVASRQDGPDSLLAALGQIPEGNYQQFVTNPEAFARAHATGQRVALMESYRTQQI